MNEMIFQLCTDGSRCLYEQIYEHIRGEIREGKLLSGERLPSTRFLAEYLQVARSTVDYAYGQLISEGYIESRPCSGYYVCPMEELVQLEGPMGTEQKDAETAGRENSGRRVKAEKNREKSPAGRSGEQETAGENGYPIDFSPYDIDMAGFPFGVWKKITKNILTYANSDLFARGESRGDETLRHTIARYLHSSRGVNCRPEQIIVGAGNDYLLMLLEKILGRHVRIAMENPTYKRSYRIFRSFAYRIATVDMDESGRPAGRGRCECGLCYALPSVSHGDGYAYRAEAGIAEMGRQRAGPVSDRG